MADAEIGEPPRDAYVAIADGTRREILDLLRTEGVLTAGEIAESFDHVSRPAISRHLRVLRECGVVRAKARGRSREYALEPRPLASVRDGWLARFGDMQSASLRSLRRRVERGS